MDTAGDWKQYRSLRKKAIDLREVLDNSFIAIKQDPLQPLTEEYISVWDEYIKQRCRLYGFITNLYKKEYDSFILLLEASRPEDRYNLWSEWDSTF